MATNREISLLLTALEEVFPHKENLTDAGLKLWCAVLADIPYPLLQTAVQDYISTGKFFPFPSDIREIAARLMNPNIPGAMEAWNEIQGQLSMPRHRLFYCDEAIRLRGIAAESSGNDYAQKLVDWSAHTEKCDVCKREEIIPKFSHPVIETAFHAMGGNKLRSSEFGVADRSQFVKAYEQLVSKELREQVTLPDVKNKAKELQDEQVERPQIEAPKS